MATFLWDRKLLLCSVTSSPRIALAILAKQSAGFAFGEVGLSALFARMKNIFIWNYCVL